MNRMSVVPVLLLASVLGLQVEVGRCSTPLALSLQRSGSKVNLSWPSTLNVPPQGTVFPEYTVEYSGDLQHWEPLGGRVRGLSGASGPLLSLSLDTAPGPNFYRVAANLSSQTPQETGSGGAEVFGYGAQFSTELAQLGLMSANTFAANTPQPPYLSRISWDPTTALFWTNFNTDPAVWNAGLPPNSPDRRLYDFRLDTNEFAIFRTNGFVVSERLGSASFADSYYRTFTDDLPVFVSADSVLHAWHRTYVSMLEELEELQLATLLEQVLTNAAAQLPQVRAQYGSGPLGLSIQDADYYLTVARSLWAGQQVPCSTGFVPVNLRATSTLTAITNLTLQYVSLFGTTSYRWVDFSQFTVRGHYNNSDRLRRYFKTMMWCGQIDLRVATFAPNKEDDIRELGTAIVLNSLLNQSGQYTNWSLIEQITSAFVGITDSMTFAQLNDLLGNANIHSLADVPNLLTLTNLQTRLLTGELGVQNIHGDAFYSPLSRDQVKLPRSFTVCGQKFTLDSWAFSQVVYDTIPWAPDDGVNVIGGKVIRRKPSCLDVAFSVLGNDQTVPDLVARITSTNGERWRDGLPYQHNLTAVRHVIDSQDAGIWTNNIYTGWLAALRALSAPTTDPIYPEAMRTRAWGMKTLNAQLASWTELRHDTLLYVQQSYTAIILCGYPAGFVEPRPEFWQRMSTLAALAANAVAALPLSGTISLPSRDTSDPYPRLYDLAGIKSHQVAHLNNFAAQMNTLQAIASKELAQQPLNQQESDFLLDIIEQHSIYNPSGRQYNGWYPGLFYQNAFQTTPFGLYEGSDMWDAMVADVHTDSPDPVVGDPGAVIHEGIGHVHLLMIAVDNGPDRIIYAGPVLSHYEFEMPGTTRMSDADWKANLRAGQKPPSPDWTKSYLVPGPFTVPPGYY
jgi:hypothetical protein